MVAFWARRWTMLLAVLVGLGVVYVWFGGLAAFLATVCLALGCAFGRGSCDDRDLDGHR
jgi:hypothetical protein